MHQFPKKTPAQRIPAERLPPECRQTVRQAEICKPNDCGHLARRRSMPYIKGVSEGTARILGRHGIQAGHKPCGTLRQLLMQPKDPLPHFLRSDIVYRVGCKGCNTYYVGETRKTLQGRIREHQGTVRGRETTSLIWMHTAETGHSFDFDHGHFKGERLVKEALH